MEVHLGDLKFGVLINLKSVVSHIEQMKIVIFNFKVFLPVTKRRAH